MRVRTLALVVVLVALAAAGWGATFHFTATADPRQFDAAFDLVLAAIQAKAGGLGAFHASPGDIDPPQSIRARIDTRFGTSAIWYPGIGNHEEETAADMTWLRDEYNIGNGGRTPLKSFTNQDGPPGTAETNYSWDYGNAHFIMLNQYWNGGTAPGSDVATDGDMVTALRDWLAQDLAQNTKPVVIVFGHEPAYPFNRHVGDSLDKYPANRDAFWSLLESDPAVLAFVVGHTHYYSKYQKPGGRVWQIDLGNAGNDGGDGKTFLDAIVTDTSVTFDIWRDGGTGNYAKTDSWSVPVTEAMPAASLNVKEGASLTIDGNPGDWSLAEFTSYIRGGQSGRGDIALVGWDDGTLYYGGYWTGGALPTSAADHTAKVYSRHDASYLYFLVRCDDSDVRYPNGAGANWQNDCVEIYIDPAHDGGSSPLSDSTSGVQLVIDANNQKNVYMCTEGYKSQVLDGVTSAVVRDGTGWTLEVRIAKNALDPDVLGNGTFGVDFGFRDNDNNNDAAQTTTYGWNDNMSGASFPSKIPDKWGDASLVVTVCLSDALAYANGNLNGNGGWSGSATTQIVVENQSAKVSGGSGAADAAQALSCALPGNQVGVWAKIKKGTGTSIFWNLWIDDPSGNNFGYWFGTGTSVRGRTGSLMTSAQTLTTAGWDYLYLKIDFAANTTQFFFNGASLGSYSHATTGASDALGRVRFERLDSSGASGHYLYFDDLQIAVPDATAPAPIVSAPSAAITRTCPVSYTVTFDDPVIGFNSSGDIQVNSTGSAATGSVVVTGSGSGPYTVALSNIIGSGTLGITVKASSCVDAAGNVNSASTASAVCKVLAADGSISSIKGLSDDASVELGSKGLFLKQTGFAYIEEPGRTAGVRIEGALAGSQGDRVCLTGVMRTTTGGERCVLVDAMSSCETQDIRPLGCSNFGLLDSKLTGLRVKVWGKVKPGSITGDSYVLTDGSGVTGIKVFTPGAPGVGENEFVTVVGAAGLDGVRVVYEE